MIYIPVVGFVYALCRTVWAQHQLDLGIITLDQ